MNWKRPWLGWLLAWALAAGGGATWLAQQRLQELHETFTTNARVAHRLLSQQLAQHDAILATLSLLQPALSSDAAANAGSSGLSTLYPQVLGVAQRRDDQPWPAHWPADLQALEQQSAASGHAQMDASRLAQGKLFVVQAGQPASYALKLDLHATVPADEWPYPASHSPVRIWLAQGTQSLVLQHGADDAQAPGWALSVSKTLSSPARCWNCTTLQAAPTPAAVAQHAGLGPGLGTGSGGLARRLAATRRPPAGRTAAAIRPDCAPQHPGRTGRRHGP
jgi:hypothetical protein